MILVSAVCRAVSERTEKGNGIRCLVNPLTGMEDEYDLTPTEKAKQVLVIGGGIAGCEAAISAALKGHKVTLIGKK